jgi:hypothetical protein
MLSWRGRPGGNTGRVGGSTLMVRLSTNNSGRVTRPGAKRMGVGVGHSRSDSRVSFRGAKRHHVLPWGQVAQPSEWGIPKVTDRCLLRKRTATWHRAGQTAGRMCRPSWPRSKGSLDPALTDRAISYRPSGPEIYGRRSSSDQAQSICREHDIFW